MTASIQLIALDRDELVSLLEDPDAFAAAHEVTLGVARGPIAEVVAQLLAFGDTTDIAMPWGGYLTMDATTRQAVGTCSFKGPPDEERSVEIAYYTFEPFEALGYASAMAAALTRQARASGEVAKVVAHTLAEENASVRILRGLGFAHVGELIDPEDGPIWRWEA